MTIFSKYNTRGYYRIAVSSFFAVQGLVFASWASRIPDIKRLLNLSDAALGGVLLSIPIGQMSAMALSGYCVGRFGSRRMLMISAVLYPLSLVMLGVIISPWFLSFALVIFGMTANLTNISVNTQAVGIERLYLTPIMASFHGLWSLAGFIGGLISTVMVGLSITPFVHFCIICVLSIMVLIIMHGALLPRDAPKHDDRDKPQQKSFAMPDRMIVVLGVIVFGSMICEGTMFDWSGVYFEQVIHPPKELIRLGYIAFMCTMAIGRFTADRLVARFGAMQIIRASGIVIAIGLLISVIFPYVVTATIGFLLVGFGVSSIVPLCYSLAGKSKIMKPGAAIAAVSTIGFLGFLSGPPVIGFVAEALNLRWSFALIAIIGLFISIASPMLRSANK